MFEMFGNKIKIICNGEVIASDAQLSEYTISLDHGYPFVYFEFISYSKESFSSDISSNISSGIYGESFIKIGDYSIPFIMKNYDVRTIETDVITMGDPRIRKIINTVSYFEGSCLLADLPPATPATLMKKEPIESRFEILDI